MPILYPDVDTQTFEYDIGAVYLNQGGRAGAPYRVQERPPAVGGLAVPYDDSPLPVFEGREVSLWAYMHDEWVDVTFTVLSFKLRYGWIESARIGGAAPPMDGTVLLTDPYGYWSLFNPHAKFDPTPGVPLEIHLGPGRDDPFLFEGFSEGVRWEDDGTDRYHPVLPLLGPIGHLENYGTGFTDRLTDDGTPSDIINVILSAVGYTGQRHLSQASAIQLYEEDVNRSALLAMGRTRVKPLGSINEVCIVEGGLFWDGPRNEVTYTPYWGRNPEEAVTHDITQPFTARVHDQRSLIVNRIGMRQDSYETYNERTIHFKSSQYPIVILVPPNVERYTWVAPPIDWDEVGGFLGFNVPETSFISTWRQPDISYLYRWEAKGTDTEYRVEFDNPTDRPQQAVIGNVRAIPQVRITSSEFDARNGASIRKYGPRGITYPEKMIRHEDEAEGLISYFVQRFGGILEDGSAFPPVGVTVTVRQPDVVYRVSDIVRLTWDTQYKVHTRQRPFWIDGVEYIWESEGYLDARLHLQDADVGRAPRIIDDVAEPRQPQGEIDVGHVTLNLPEEDIGHVGLETLPELDIGFVGISAEQDIGSVFGFPPPAQERDIGSVDVGERDIGFVHWVVPVPGEEDIGSVGPIGEVDIGSVQWRDPNQEFDIGSVFIPVEQDIGFVEPPILRVTYGDYVYSTFTRSITGVRAQMDSFDGVNYGIIVDDRPNIRTGAEGNPWSIGSHSGATGDNVVIGPIEDGELLTLYYRFRGPQAGYVDPTYRPADRTRYSRAVYWPLQVEFPPPTPGLPREANIGHVAIGEDDIGSVGIAGAVEEQDIGFVQVGELDIGFVPISAEQDIGSIRIPLPPAPMETDIGFVGVSVEQDIGNVNVPRPVAVTETDIGSVTVSVEQDIGFVQWTVPVPVERDIGSVTIRLSGRLNAPTVASKGLRFIELRVRGTNLAGETIYSRSRVGSGSYVAGSTVIVGSSGIPPANTRFGGLEPGTRYECQISLSSAFAFTQTIFVTTDARVAPPPAPMPRLTGTALISRNSSSITVQPRGSNLANQVIWAFYVSTDPVGNWLSLGSKRVSAGGSIPTFTATGLRANSPYQFSFGLTSNRPGSLTSPTYRTLAGTTTPPPPPTPGGGTTQGDIYGMTADLEGRMLTVVLTGKMADRVWIRAHRSGRTIYTPVASNVAISTGSRHSYSIRWPYTAGVVQAATNSTFTENTLTLTVTADSE